MFSCLTSEEQFCLVMNYTVVSDIVGKPGGFMCGWKLWTEDCCCTSGTAQSCMDWRQMVWLQWCSKVGMVWIVDMFGEGQEWLGEGCMDCGMGCRTGRL